MKKKSSETEAQKQKQLQHQNNSNNKKKKNNASSLKSSKGIKIVIEESEDEENTMNSISSCSFPTSRIRRLISGGEWKKSSSNSRPSHEAVFLINKATEMFLRRFVHDSYAVSVGDRRKSLSYKHLSSLVNRDSKYEFLSDFVPEKLRAEDALKEAAKVG